MYFNREDFTSDYNNSHEQNDLGCYYRTLLYILLGIGVIYAAILAGLMVHDYFWPMPSPFCEAEERRRRDQEDDLQVTAPAFKLHQE